MTDIGAYLNVAPALRVKILGQPRFWNIFHTRWLSTYPAILTGYAVESARDFSLKISETS